MGIDRAGRRTRRLIVVSGVLALLVAAAVVTFRAVFGDYGKPALPRVEVAEGFPPVPPPSFDGPSSAPATSPSASRRPPRSPGTISTKAAGTPITEYSACSAPSTVTFTATYTESFGYRRIFVDTDANASTGHQPAEVAGGFGADYMIENEVLYASTGPDWSWREVAGVSPLLSVTGGTYRWRVEPAYASGRIVFNASDGEGTAERYTPVVEVQDC